MSEELKACKSFSDTSSILLQNQENDLRQEFSKEKQALIDENEKSKALLERHVEQH